MKNNTEINKAFGYMDTVTFREGDRKDIEYIVTGYEKDGRVNIENRANKLTISQERLKLVKNGILFQKDDIVKFTEDAKYDRDFVKPHYIPNTNHFRVMGVSRNDGTLRIGNPGNPGNCKDDGTFECIQILPSQLGQLELVTKKIQIRKMHGSEDTEITLFLPTSHRIHCTLDTVEGLTEDDKKNFDINSVNGSILTAEVKRQMIKQNLAWVGYQNKAWYTFDCIKPIKLCMTKTIPCTRKWKGKNIRITRVVITDDLRFHPKSDATAKYDWALVGNTQLHRNFIGLNRPLQPSSCESKKASTKSNLTNLPCRLKISYDEDGNPLFNTEKEEEAKLFMTLIRQAMTKVIEEENLGPE